MLVGSFGYGFDCDLLSCVRDAPGGGKPFLELHPLIIPNDPANIRQRSAACKFSVTFQARGLEADSNQLSVQIAWDGQWEDGNEEMAQHLVVRALS